MIYKGFLKQINATTLRLTTKESISEYRGYNIGDIPRNFGFIFDETEDTEGIYKWFNYKGLTYILTRAKVA